MLISILNIDGKSLMYIINNIGPSTLWNNTYLGIDRKLLTITSFVLLLTYDLSHCRIKININIFNNS